MIKVVAGSNSNKVSISLLVGGWTGSRFFSFLVGDSQNRTIFSKTISWAVKKYKFDGVDLDWEYPNFQGLGCNALIKDDSKIFSAFKRIWSKHSPV
ncbi:glycoside hydrolase superfamily [Phakopsora pachyrhizi]|uniref:Glycoside hydrolase superfamily n=1 Tax=Phakopsora pachyrhizi TaxID=170000 RepID=A0AAV0ANI9_PHAPC|nr:glycoside hydrolase superfamily [Phakopsora pachyrhizi]